MTALPAPNRASLYEQLCALPENLTGELIDGQLHAQPRPSGRHGLAERALNVDLGGPYDFGRNGPGGWWIIPEPEVHFVRDSEVAVPDLAGWRRARRLAARTHAAGTRRPALRSRSGLGL